MGRDELVERVGVGSVLRLDLTPGMLNLGDFTRGGTVHGWVGLQYWGG